MVARTARDRLVDDAFANERVERENRVVERHDAAPRRIELRERRRERGTDDAGSSPVS